MVLKQYKALHLPAKNTRLCYNRNKMWYTMTYWLNNELSFTGRSAQVQSSGGLYSGASNSSMYAVPMETTDANRGILYLIDDSRMAIGRTSTDTPLGTDAHVLLTPTPTSLGGGKPSTLPHLLCLMCWYCSACRKILGLAEE